MTVAATLILTIILWVLYHKIFNVIYFNAPKGCMVEIFVCFMIAAIISTILFGNPKKDDKRSSQVESNESSHSSVFDNRPDSTSKSSLVAPNNNSSGESAEISNSETANGDETTLNYDGRDYSEGVVWVKRIIPYAGFNTVWCLCDTAANILFALDLGSEPTTNYVNGVAIIDHNTIIDKAGNVISSVEDGIYEEMIFFNDGYGEALFLGYTFVSDSINTFDYSGFRCGILDNKGEWYLELTPNIQFNGYRGEGIFSYTENTADETLYGEYNLYTNQFRLYDDNYSSNDNTSMKDGALRNSRGEIVDLSKYYLIGNPDSLYFEDGYCLIDVMNDNGGMFMTVIDEEGNRLFEPIPCEGHGKLSNGLIAILKDGERQFININGETVIHLPYATKIYDFSNDGIARIEYEAIDSNYEAYIPAVQYIDTHGNEIF